MWLQGKCNHFCCGSGKLKDWIRPSQTLCPLQPSCQERKIRAMMRRREPPADCSYLKQPRHLRATVALLRRDHGRARPGAPSGAALATTAARPPLAPLWPPLSRRRLPPVAKLAHCVSRPRASILVVWLGLQRRPRDQRRDSTSCTSRDNSWLDSVRRCDSSVQREGQIAPTKRRCVVERIWRCIRRNKGYNCTSNGRGNLGECMDSRDTITTLEKRKRKRKRWNRGPSHTTMRTRRKRHRAIQLGDNHACG